MSIFANYLLNGGQISTDGYKNFQSIIAVYRRLVTDTGYL